MYIYILRHMLKQTTSLFNTSESQLQIYLIIFRHTTAGQGLALYRPAAANITLQIISPNFNFITARPLGLMSIMCIKNMFQYLQNR
jgi:hypothetical protein